MCEHARIALIHILHSQTLIHVWGQFDGTLWYLGMNLANFFSVTDQGMLSPQFPDEECSMVIMVTDDCIPEDDEVLTINVTVLTNGTMVSSTVNVSVIDNDTGRYM